MKTASACKLSGDTRHRLWEATKLFDACVTGDHFWHDLSTACDSLRHLSDARQNAISIAERDNLLRALSGARSVYCFRDQIEPQRDRSTLLDGFDALAGQILLLAEGGGKGEFRHPDTIADMRAKSRMLQNLAHNQSLQDEIDARKIRRRAAVVEKIKLQVLGKPT